MRSPQRSPGTSPRNSPKRRPLHERSDSQANEQILPSYLDPKLLSHHDREPAGRVYDKDPFPTLPSQVLTPSGGFPIFEDKTATGNLENVVVTRPSSPKHVRTKSEKGKAKRRPSPERASQASVLSVDLPPPASGQPVPSASLVSIRKQQLEALDAAVKRAEQMRAEQLASRASMRPLPTSNSGADEARDRAFLAKYQSLVLDRFAPGDRSSFQLPEQESYFQRPRSRASSHTISRPASRHSTRKSEERPRSASQPAPEAIGEDLSALLAQGIEVQYAKIKQPSMTSLRSESSSLRRAYPAPLRLKRKLGEERLARKQSGPELSTKSGTSLNSRPGASSSTSLTERPQTEGAPSHSFAVEFPDSPDMDLSLTLPEDSHAHGHDTDEQGDTLCELHTPALRPQRSGYLSEKGSVSRPGSSRSMVSQTSVNSLATHQQFLTFFLNDSHTTWAPPYYGGKSRLYLEAPSVVNLTPVPRPVTPNPGIERSPSNWGSISGMSSSSYSSSDYPSQIYIPRVRALKGAHIPDYLMNDESLHTSNVSQSISYATGDDPSIREASEGIRQQPRHWRQPVDDYYRPPTARGGTIGFDSLDMPETPRLRPDRNLGFSIYSLRTPSLDQYERPWGQTNRQYWMLLFGFIFPLSWMLAACLPIPPRPDWSRNPTNSRIDLEADITDLWNSQEVRRYQKARRWRVFNRFMSMFGLCVIGVVVSLEPFLRCFAHLMLPPTLL